MKFGRGLNDERGFIWIEVRGENIWFSHDFESKAVADIVDDAIAAGMADRIKEIRRTAYEQGWSDKLRKKLKYTYFNGCVNSDSVGY